MRVLCSGMTGGDIEGELIRGGFLDADTGEFDLEETFAIRCDDGQVVEVHGWLVEITVVDEKLRRLM